MVVGCTGLAAVIAYSFAAGGSSRGDAEVQNAIALLLLLASGAAAAYTAWTGYGRTIMWKGDAVRVRSLAGADVIRRISDVRSVTESTALGDYRLVFRDGSTLRFPVYFHGARQLFDRLPPAAPGR